MADMNDIGAPRPAVGVASPSRPPARPVGLRAGLAALAGAIGMVFVGGSVAVSGELVGAPLFTAQAVRYGFACLLLVAFAALARRRVRRPRGTEWLWLLGVVATGLLLFNVALVRGAEHAEPAVLGVAVACVPLVLAALGPLLEGRPPSARLLSAALVVTCGAGLVQGVGRSDLIGLLWALVVLGCEAGFTLLAIPLLGRHGAWGVSVHTTWIAALLFAATGVVTEGPAAIASLTTENWWAIGYLAVCVTAAAFVLWYACVHRLGAGRAGLLTGIAPISAAVVGIALGGAAPRSLVWLGVAIVGVGLLVGLRSHRTPRDRSGD